MAFRSLKQLLRNESGASAILVSLAAPPLIGATAIAVDFGMLYLEERDIQGVADAAAMSAVMTDEISVDGEGKAQAIIDRADISNVQIKTFTPGKYTADVDVALEDRFEAREFGTNAVEVRLTRQVPLMMGTFFGDQFSTVTARARAARTDMVAFDIGSDLLGFDKNLPGRYLEALVDNNLALNKVEVNALLNAEFDVGTFAELLRDSVGEEGDLLGDVFSGDASIDDVITAMAGATSDEDAREALLRIADRVGGDDISLSSLMDLGPLERQVSDRSSDRMNVSVYMMLRAALQNVQGDSYSAEISTEIEGFGSVDVKVAGGEHTTESPFLAVDPLKNITLYTTQTRIAVTAKTTAASIGNVTVPVFIELAPAEAQITEVVCDPSDDRNGVTLRVKPSIGSAKIGEVDYDNFYDFTTNPEVSMAKLVETPVLQVLGYADLAVGGDEDKYVRLSLDQIKANQRQRVATTDTVQALINSLINRLDIEVNTLGLSLSRQDVVIENQVLRGLGQLAPSVDGLLNEVTNMVGVKLGMADVGVTSLACGRPTIVG